MFWAQGVVLLIHVTTDLSLFIKWISFRFFLHVHTWAIVSTRGEVKESLCLDEMAAAATHVSAKISQDSELHKLHLCYIKPVRLNEWADKLLRIQCEPKYTPLPPHWPKFPTDQMNECVWPACSDSLWNEIWSEVSNTCLLIN